MAVVPADNDLGPRHTMADVDVTWKENIALTSRPSIHVYSSSDQWDRVGPKWGRLAPNGTN